jgi:hypothetical protein
MSICVWMCICICMLDFDILIKRRKSWYTHKHDYKYICIIIFIYLCCPNFWLKILFPVPILKIYMKQKYTYTHVDIFFSIYNFMHIITSIYILRMLCVIFTDILSNFVPFIFQNFIGSQTYIYIYKPIHMYLYNRDFVNCILCVIVFFKRILYFVERIL